MRASLTSPSLDADEIICLTVAGEDRLGIGNCERFHLCRNIHRAKLRSAHRTKMCIFETLFRKSLVVHRTRGLRIERQLKLPVPVEPIARSRQFVIAITCSGTMASNVGRVRSDLI